METPAAKDDNRADVGILLVHGIGEQQRSTTVLSFGDPATRFLERWARARGCTVDTAGSELEPAPSGERKLPHIRRVIAGTGPDAPRLDLLMAEAWWDKKFPPPSYREVAKWLLVVVPWLLVRQVDRWIRLPATTRAATFLTDVVKEAGKRESGGTVISGAVGAVWALVAFYALGLLRLLQATATVVVGLLLQLLLVGLFCATFLPKGKQLALAVQRKIARGLGDSYSLVTSPGRHDAMITAVSGDIDTLAQRARRLVVVGHSQGAAIARTAILRSRNSAVTSLVTVGPGIAKLHQLESVLERPGRLVGAWLLRISAVVVLDAALVLEPSIGEGWLFFLVLIPGLIALDVSEGLVPAPRQVDADTLGIPQFKALGIEWSDFYTAMDPVPEGPLFAPGSGPPSTSVVNRHSIRRDHTTYWGNIEQILAPVLITAATAAGRTSALLADDDLERLAVSRIRRNRRGYWLLVGQAATAAAAIALLAAPPGTTLEAIGHRIVVWVREIPALPKFTPTDDIVTLMGAAIVVLACVLWYRVMIVALWSRLQRHATQCLIDRQNERALRMTELGVRLSVLCAVACLLAPIFRYGEVSADEGSWQLGLFTLLLAGVGFVLFWRVVPRRANSQGTTAQMTSTGEPPS